ncbi:MAG: efflux transporter periplasmic adaptor subunit, partial [Halocynthiibacter sp.]
MRFLRRSLTGLFLLSLTAGLLGWAGYVIMSALEARWAEEGFEPPVRERVFAVNVMPYATEDIAPVLSAFGEVRSRRTLDLRATTSGTVVMLAESFVEGGRVETGLLLLRIDPAEAQSALDRVKTDVSEAEGELRDGERALTLAGQELATTEAQAELRRRALARQQDLRERGVGTEASVEAAELAAVQADQAVVSRRQAEGQGEAQLALART